MSFEYKRSANYYETDRMGIVHHSNHIRYFEEARLAYLDSIGFHTLELENQGLIIPNVDAYAKYVSPIKFDEKIIIEVELVKFSGVIMKFEYTIKNEEHKSVKANGFTTHCFVNEKFKPMSIKRTFPEQFKLLSKITKAPES